MCGRSHEVGPTRAPTGYEPGEPLWRPAEGSGPPARQDGRIWFGLRARLPARSGWPASATPAVGDGRRSGPLASGSPEPSPQARAHRARCLARVDEGVEEPPVFALGPHRPAAECEVGDGRRPGPLLPRSAEPSPQARAHRARCLARVDQGVEEPPVFAAGANPSAAAGRPCGLRSRCTILIAGRRQDGRLVAVRKDCAAPLRTRATGYPVRCPKHLECSWSNPCLFREGSSVRPPHVKERTVKG